MVCELSKAAYEDARNAFRENPEDEALRCAYEEARTAYECCLDFVHRFHLVMRSKAALDAWRHVNETREAQHQKEPFPFPPDDPRAGVLRGTIGTRRVRDALFEHPEFLVDLSYAIESSLRNSRITLDDDEAIVCDLHVIKKPKSLSEVPDWDQGGPVRLYSAPIMRAVARKVRADRIDYPRDDFTEVEAEIQADIGEDQPANQKKSR